MHDRIGKKKTAKVFIVLVFLAVFLLFSGCVQKTDEDSLEETVLSDGSQSGESTSQKEDTGQENPQETVFVYVCGAVNVPGVYELQKDARVFEAVEQAGGMTDAASPDAVNQARIVSDGEQIYVPTVEEAQTQSLESAASSGAGVSGKVNINTAGKEELMTLTGIGEAKAQSIMDYREEHGGFTAIEDLMQIEGIKEGVFNKIREDIII